MSKELFDSMQKQMNPSPEIRAALSEELARPAKKRPAAWKKYGAVAACAVLVIGAYAVYQAGKPRNQILYGKVPLHSYVMAEGLTGYVQENAATATGGEEGGVYSPADGGDRDMDMTPGELEQAMLDVGYPREEIEEYQSIGYQMTWAKWWKFVDGQKNSEGDDPFNLDSLEAFSQKELLAPSGALPAPNTGDLPGGAYIGDAPSQEEAVNAYQKLMDRFDGQYPDWYGGAYIDGSGWLVVQLVSDKDPGDKTLELQVLDWTDSDHVMFSSCKYSLSYLRDLQDKVVDAMSELDLFSGCGADEELNRLDLTLTSVTDKALIVLAELDPEDDAIYVQVGQRAAADVGGEDVRTDSVQTEDPAVHHIMPGGVTVPDTPVPEGDDPIAFEPFYDGARYDLEHLPEELPQQKLPAFEADSAPEEDISSNASSRHSGS